MRLFMPTAHYVRRKLAFGDRVIIFDLMWLSDTLNALARAQQCKVSLLQPLVIWGTADSLFAELAVRVLRIVTAAQEPCFLCVICMAEVFPAAWFNDACCGNNVDCIEIELHLGTEMQ